jgi:GNAT superfamily N-acetyltransferase
VSEISIRRGREDDAAAMAAIYVEAAQKAWAHIYGAENLKGLEPPVKSFRLDLRSTDERHRVIVAEQDNRVVGFAVIRPSQDDDADPTEIGELDTLYTSPTRWGTGVGRFLLAEAVETLRRCGFREATLWTAEDNHRPRHIYEGAGWSPDGTDRHRTWRGVRFREVRYRIPITG